MEILSDRIGIIVKYGKVMGGLTKRYFFIDNKGTLYYTDKDNLILDLLKLKNYDNDKFVSILASNSKIIQLQDCSTSGIKSFLEKKFELQGRSYFELYVKARDYRSILLFSWQEEFIKTLHDYVSTFRELDQNLNQEEVIFEGEITGEGFATDTGEIKINTESQTFGKSDYSTTNNIFSNIDNTKDKKYMENVLAKLGGRLVNQNLWDKEYIKIVNPTQDMVEYEETWVELENGSNYSGPVKDGMPHGYGKEYRPDGSLYTGYFYKGKWHGPGILTTETLDTYHAEFIDGCVCGI